MSAGKSSVSGVVTVAKGVVAPGAIVIANRVSIPSYTARVLTGASGAFQFTGLPAGSYRLCVQFPDETFADPCEWGVTGFALNQVALRAGTALTGVKVTAKAASSISIQILDPGHILDKTDAVVNPHVVIGVMTSGGVFRPARLVSKDAAGRNHRLTVPLDTNVKLIVSPHNVVLADALGTVIPDTGTTVALVQRSDALAVHAPVILLVKGLKQ